MAPRRPFHDRVSGADDGAVTVQRRVVVGKVEGVSNHVSAPPSVSAMACSVNSGISSRSCLLRPLTMWSIMRMSHRCIAWLVMCSWLMSRELLVPW